MLPFVRWALISAALVGWLVVAGTAAAALTAEVRDEGGFFTADAIKRANEVIKEIKHQYKRDLLIETYKTVPADKAEEVKKMDRQALNKFFADWARSRAKSAEVNGIYVLITKEPTHLQVEVGNETQKKAFTLRDRDKLSEVLLDRFREAAKIPNENEKKALYDKGLLEAVEFVRKTLNENVGKAPTASVPAPAGGGGRSSPHPAENPSEGFPIMGSVIGLVCIGLVVVLVVWLIFGLIRAFTGVGRGGYGGGGGPGYGYGGGGGGGGGFMSGLLGGLFGAVAGNWMYNSFFGGGASHGGWDSSSAYGAGAGTAPGSQPEDTDYSGTGGDFDNAGGDTGGGGDFGGGGGDFGGGGGDFGGGGGDFGGGGGDFGGGGGGGDF